MKKIILVIALSSVIGSVLAVPVGYIGKKIDRDPVGSTYSAQVKYTTWGYNSNGQYVSTLNFLTLTGTTMAYCQQQLSAVMASPGVSVVQFCQID